MAGKELALEMILGLKDATAAGAKTATKTLGSLGKLAGGLALAGVGAAGAMGGIAIGLAKDSAVVQQARDTFGKLAESIGSDSVTALDGLRDATRGMVADSDLMLAGNKFMAMGLADSAEKAAELAEVATQLGMAMGEDATSSMENFALMMANQSIPRLDSFGISSGQVRTRIDELMEATAGLTREEAFNMAVMEQARATMDKVGEQGNSTAAKMAAMQANFANVKDVIGQAFIPILDALLTPLSALATEHGPAVVAWAQTAATWMGENIPIALQKLSDFWQTILLPAITIVSDYITVTVIPILEKVYEWFQENFPPTMESLARMWDTTLLPAIKLVWGFLNDSVVPLVKTFVEVQLAAFSLALQALKGVWENYVQPALEGLWTKIGGLEGAFDGISRAVSWVNTKLEKFKNWLSGLSIPDWLTPGSPTPLENGLVGIASGFGAANDAAMDFFDTLSNADEPYATDGGINAGGRSTSGTKTEGGIFNAAQYGSNGRGLAPTPERDDAAWREHVILPPENSDNVPVLNVNFLYDGELIGEVTVRSDTVTETAIDLNAIMASKG